MFKIAAKATIRFLLSPAARRYEALLLVGVYEAIRAALGSA